MSSRNNEKVDLHTHSNFSDGRLSPEDLVEEAVWRGVSVMALTDHDTVDGLQRARGAASKKGMKLVPGVELSCEIEGRELHLVGLFIEPDAGFLQKLDNMRREREQRMQAMLKRLEAIGIHITMQDLPQGDNRSLGRPHLADILIRRKIVGSVREAFEKYLGDDGPVNIPKQRFTFEEGMGMIHDVNGLAIVAHPGVSNLMDQLPYFAQKGVDGIEAYYPRHTSEQERRISEICREYDILMSGGSDFHGNSAGPDLGVPRVPIEIYESLKERKERYGRVSK